MPGTGKIVKWDEEKGFGFIAPAAGGRQVFVHVSALRGIPRGAVLGAEVAYAETRDAEGRLRAESVKPVAAVNTLGPAARAFFTAAVFLLVLLGLVAMRTLPMLLFWLYVGLSLCSFALYALDKHAARKGSQRTAENTLHLLALAGGWPGALFAQQFLRHKSAKTSFRVVFWLTVLLNLGALAYLLSPAGARWLAGLPLPV